MAIRCAGFAACIAFMSSVASLILLPGAMSYSVSTMSQEPSLCQMRNASPAQNAPATSIPRGASFSLILWTSSPSSTTRIRMILVLPQCRVLHFLDDATKFAHRYDQLGLLGVLAPVAGHDKSFVVVLYSLVSVIFGFEEIECHSDISAFDIATFVESERGEHKDVDKLH